MNESLDERRMAANEVIFRQHNERVSDGFEKLQNMAEEHDQDPSEYEDDSNLQFYCECSDENCFGRVSLSPSVYREKHKNRSRFTIIPGHEVGDIERIVEKHNEYFVIEKNITPPESVSKLHKTDVTNV